MRKHLLQSPGILLLGMLYLLLQNWVEDTLDGCEDNLPKWRLRRRSTLSSLRDLRCMGEIVMFVD